MDMFVIRQAKNEDGDKVAALVEKGTGFSAMDGWSIDWSNIEPYWIIAELNDEMVGVLQFCPSKPIARLEFLGIDPELPKTLRYRIAESLTRQGAAMAMQMGSQGVSGIISHENPEFQEAALKAGWLQAVEGYLYYKSIEA